MTSDEDRLCVAATLVRRAVSIANIRRAIEEQSRRPSQSSISDLLVELGVISAAERNAFLQLLHERLDHESNRANAFQLLLQREVEKALRIVDDPIVRSFLTSSSMPGDIEMRSTTSFRLRCIENEGGLGQIWLAMEENTCREVAVKRIKPAVRQEKEIRHRFFQEAQIIGKLQHPNIVPVYHLGKTSSEQEPYYAMPFIQGRTFEEVLGEAHARKGDHPFDPETLNHLLSIFLKVCDAVGYANSCGIIHRDLKPQNIMVGQFGEVFVLDWGLAKDAAAAAEHEIQESAQPVDRFVTHCGAVLGSPLYMAPEQAGGRTDEIDARTDVYGLGGVLHKLLSGCEPNAIDLDISLEQNLAHLAEGPRPSIRQIAGRIPPALAAICDKALASRQEDRYATARDLAKDVERWLVGSPVSVYREPAMQSLARWAVQHRRLASTGAALIGLLVIAATATLASTWAYANAAMDRERHVMELNQMQVIASIQGDIKRAYIHAGGMAERMQFADLLRYRRAGDLQQEKRWTEQYQPLVEANLEAAGQFHAAAIFSSANQTQPDFFFRASPGRRFGAMEALFQPDHRPFLEKALRETAALKPGETWCSSPLVLTSNTGEPLPVVIGGFPIFKDAERCGTMLTAIDFRVALADLVTDLHLSVSISITGEDGIPFFHLNAKEDLAGAYRNIPPLPYHLEELIRKNRHQDLYIDELYREHRELACVSSAPLMEGKTEPYVGIVLVADYDELIREPSATRWWVAGIVTAVVVTLMLGAWLIVRTITLLAVS